MMLHKPQVSAFRRFVPSLRIFVVTALIFWFATLDLDHSLFQYILRAAGILAVGLMVLMPASVLDDWTRLPEAAIFGVHRRTILWLGGGIFMLFAVLSYLEYRQPFYFVQDDNHAQFFPTILQAMRGFFDEGDFPVWNGYQLLGVPTASLGYHALTYPFTYLSYALSRYVAGNEFLTIELFAWMHLAAGYVFAFFMFRRLHVRDSIAAAAGLCFVLLGFNLVVGRSWYYMLPTVTWLPALGWSLAVFMKKGESLRWIAVTATAISLYFHAGNVQMWCFACLFWGVGMVWIGLWREGPKWPALAMIAASALAGLALAMPLFIVQLLETASIRRMPYDTSIAAGLANLFIPWPFAKAPHLWAALDNTSLIYFSGGVFIFGFMIRSSLLLAWLGKAYWPRDRMVALCFPGLAVFALWLALGSKAGLWDLLAQYPPFSKFRIPFKLIPFFSFFMIAEGALLLETAFRKWPHSRVWEGLVLLLAIGAVIYNASQCTAAFRVWADHPYPALPENYRFLQAQGFTTNGRVHPFALRRRAVNGFIFTLPKNYASVYDIPSSMGYMVLSNLEAELPQNLRANDILAQRPLQFYHEFGVSWATVSTLVPDAHDTDFLDSAAVSRMQTLSSRVIDLGWVKAYEIADKETKPMAYEVGAPAHALPYRIRTNGVDIATGDMLLSVPATVTANFLYRPWFKAFDEEGDALPVRADGMGRITVEVSKPLSTLRIRYCPPWDYGLYLGLVLLLLSGMLARWVGAKNDKGMI